MCSTLMGFNYLQYKKSFFHILFHILAIVCVCVRSRDTIHLMMIVRAAVHFCNNT